MTLAVWTALALATAALAAPEDFPKPASIETRVNFWKRVYTEVGTDGGFIHDADDLSLVYEKISLPNGRWDNAAYRYVEERKRHIAYILRELARGKRSDLSDEEQRILALFPEGAGPRALHGKDDTVRFQLGQADKFRAGLARQGRWDAYIRQVFAERGLPPELGALPHVESSFNPEARSAVGASGIWQFMPGTGRLYLRVDSSVDERNDPFLATVAAARLLKLNYDATGAWPLAITSYNHGLGGMQRAARELGTKDIGVIIDNYESRSFGFASKNFYASFLAAMEIDREPEKYFGSVRRDPPLDPERVILDHYYRASTVASAFGVSLGALRDVNPAVAESVWNGKRLLPRGYELRVPRDPVRAAPKVVLAGIGGSDRIDTQIRESASSHRVRRGETLSSIAAKYGLSTRALQRANGLRSPNAIRVGQRLRVPGDTSPDASPEPTSAPTEATRVARVPVPEPTPAEGVYKVRRGDSLASIARKFGVSATDLAQVNRIRNANQIHAGQVLELPTGSLTARPEDRSHAGTYTIRRGDTLETIAKKFGVDVQQLVAHNGIPDRQRIRVGQSIYIPGPPEASASSAPPVPATVPATNATSAVRTATAPNTESAPSASTAASTGSTASAATVDPPAATSGAPPAAPATAYVVRRGDTLARIAARTGTNESELMALNGLRDRNRIAVGQTLKLPAPPAPPPAAPSDGAPADAPSAEAGTDATPVGAPSGR